MIKIHNESVMQAKKKFTRNKREKIDLIYDTFFNLILLKGYHKISTNHVAKTAKISIGTIYKYFPKGKEDIIKTYFEESMKTFIEKHDLSKTDDNNIQDYLNRFVLDLLENHRKNQGYNLAFRSAIQSDKNLLEAHKEKISYYFTDQVRKLRESNEQFTQYPERKLIDAFILIFNLVNAILYQHLSIMKLSNNDEEFVTYLSNLVAFSLNYYLKN